MREIFFFFFCNSYLIEGSCGLWLTGQVTGVMGRWEGVVEKVWPTLATCLGGLSPWDAELHAGRCTCRCQCVSTRGDCQTAPSLRLRSFCFNFLNGKQQFPSFLGIADGPIQIIQPGSYYFTVFSVKAKEAYCSRLREIVSCLVFWSYSFLIRTYDEAWWWPLKVSPDHRQIKARIFKCLALRNREPSWMLSSRLDAVCPSSSIPCGARLAWAGLFHPTRVPFCCAWVYQDSAHFLVLYNYLISMIIKYLIIWMYVKRKAEVIPRPMPLTHPERTSVWKACWVPF